MKKLLTTLIVLAWSVTLFAALPVSDAFTRADGGLGANWTNIGNAGGGSATLAVSSNRVAVNTYGTFNCALWATSADTFGNDQYAQVDIVTIAAGNGADVIVRGTGTFNGGTFSGYSMEANQSGDTALLKWTNGSAVSISPGGLSAVDYNNGDVLKLSIQGTLLTVFKNGSSIATTTDATYGSGQPGMCIYDDSSGDGQTTVLDNFAADIFAVGGATQKLLTLLGVGGTH